MTIAGTLWLRSQAAQRNFLEITTYNSAFMQHAALQALHLTWNAPATFWSAMARVGAAPAANAPLAHVASKSADVVQLVTPEPVAELVQPEPVPEPAPVVDIAPAVAPTPQPAPAPEPAAVVSAPKETAARPAVEAAKAPKAATPAPNPLLLDEPRGGKADDLTVLTGIGAKLQTALNEFGIYHFDQLAELNDDGIAWLNAQQKGFAMTCERYDIVGQAKTRAS